MPGINLKVYIMKFMKNDDAVSPVIGVILMVAITVILAAVIAAFVFGMAGNIQKTKLVAATVQQNGNNIIVTWQGGQDAATFTGGNVSLTLGSGSVGTIAYSPTVGTLGNIGPVVGCQTVISLTGAGATLSGRDHVVVTGWFGDGSQQVILDTFV